jgi:hypothetical protein
MSWPSLGISILYQLNERGKYNACALIIFCSFCCAPCLGYEPGGKFFDLETTHTIDIKSSHSGRVIPLLVSLPKKKASCQWLSLATASVVHGTATSTSEHAGLGGDMRQFSFSIQVVTNHFFKACLLAKLSGNFGMLRPKRIWSYGRMMLPMF